MYANELYANEPYAGDNQADIQLWDKWSRNTGTWSKVANDILSGMTLYLTTSANEHIITDASEHILVDKQNSWSKIGHE